MTRGFCPSALGLMDNAQDIVLIRDFRKCEKYLTLPVKILFVFSFFEESPPAAHWKLFISLFISHCAFNIEGPSGLFFISEKRVY